MSTSLNEDVDALRSGLAGDEPEIEVTLRLPGESEQKVLALLEAEQTSDALVVPAKHEFTTTEASEDPRDVAARADADDRAQAH